MRGGRPMRGSPELAGSRLGRLIDFQRTHPSIYHGARVWAARFLARDLQPLAPKAGRQHGHPPSAPAPVRRGAAAAARREVQAGGQQHQPRLGAEVHQFSSALEEFGDARQQCHRCGGHQLPARGRAEQHLPEAGLGGDGRRATGDERRETELRRRGRPVLNSLYSRRR